MKNYINFKIFLPVIAVCGLIAYGVSSFTDIGFWIIFGIVLFALVLNGVIATFEDEQPESINNQDTKENNDS